MQEIQIAFRCQQCPQREVSWVKNVVTLTPMIPAGWIELHEHQAYRGVGVAYSIGHRTLHFCSMKCLREFSANSPDEPTVEVIK